MDFGSLLQPFLGAKQNFFNRGPEDDSQRIPYQLRILFCWLQVTFSCKYRAARVSPQYLGGWQCANIIHTGSYIRAEQALNCSALPVWQSTPSIPQWYTDLRSLCIGSNISAMRCSWHPLHFDTICFLPASWERAWQPYIERLWTTCQLFDCLLFTGEWELISTWRWFEHSYPLLHIWQSRLSK